jgi:hypothetical protein
MIEVDNRQHHPAFFIYDGEAPFLNARDHFGKSGGELRAAAHPRNLAFAGRIVRSDYAVLDPLAVLVKRSVLVGARFHPSKYEFATRISSARGRRSEGASA